MPVLTVAHKLPENIYTVSKLYTETWEQIQFVSIRLQRLSAVNNPWKMSVHCLAGFSL